MQARKTNGVTTLDIYEANAGATNLSAKCIMTSKALRCHTHWYTAREEIPDQTALRERPILEHGSYDVDFYCNKRTTTVLTSRESSRPQDVLTHSSSDF